MEEMRRLRGESRELQAQLLQAHVQHQAALRALDEHVSMTTAPDSVRSPGNDPLNEGNVCNLHDHPKTWLYKTEAVKSDIVKCPPL